MPLTTRMLLRYTKELNAKVEDLAAAKKTLERLRLIRDVNRLIELLTGDEQPAQAAAATPDPEQVTPAATNAEGLADVMKAALSGNQDKPNAFKRADIDAPIDIVVGDEKKGLKHILKKREEDGTLGILTEEELLEEIAKTISDGELRIQSANEYAQRIEIKRGEKAAILNKNKGENAWLLTGWVISKEKLAELAKLPPGERRSAYFNSAPTHLSPTTSRTKVGADGTAGDPASKSNDTQAQPDPQLAIDKELLQSVLEGKHPSLHKPELATTLKEVFERAQNDSELKELFDKAVEAWAKLVIERGMDYLKEQMA